MKTTRRTFITTLSAFAVGTLAIDSSFGQKNDVSFVRSAANFGDPVDFLSKASFDPFVNSPFEMQDANGRGFRANLVEVQDRSLSVNVKHGYTGESFSLVFQPGRKVKIAEGAYTFNHHTLGTFELFLVPVGISATRYEAIVNRVGPTG